ncbi:hypothetical protein FB451DRAFT_1407861 [Mycena latifolia]|nr:hypothetical protein FB451DRAFT_1407861 [Mycena latifolia]
MRSISSIYVSCALLWAVFALVVPGPQVPALQGSAEGKAWAEVVTRNVPAPMSSNQSKSSTTSWLI